MKITYDWEQVKTPKLPNHCIPLNQIVVSLIMFLQLLKSKGNKVYIAMIQHQTLAKKLIVLYYIMLTQFVHRQINQNKELEQHCHSFGINKGLICVTLLNYKLQACV